MAVLYTVFETRNLLINLMFILAVAYSNKPSNMELFPLVYFRSLFTAPTSCFFRLATHCADHWFLFLALFYFLFSCSYILLLSSVLSPFPSSSLIQLSLFISLPFYIPNINFTLSDHSFSVSHLLPPSPSFSVYFLPTAWIYYSCQNSINRYRGWNCANLQDNRCKEGDWDLSLLCNVFLGQHYWKTSWKGQVVTGTALQITHCHQVVGYIPWQQGLSLSDADWKKKGQIRCEWKIKKVNTSWG